MILLRHSTQPPERGPFNTLRKNKEYFNVCIKNVAQNLFLDRLKPTFLDVTCLNVSPQIMLIQLVVTNRPKQAVTRFGQHVHTPR